MNRDLPGATSILRLSQVQARTGLSRSAIYRAIRDRELAFPPPIKLTARSSGWPACLVDEWIQKRIAASRHGLADSSPAKALEG
jgi:prophage regulatory protein